MKITVRSPLVHVCPFADEIDVGEVEMTFEGDAPELYDLRRHLERFATQALTHEAITRQLAEDFPQAEIVTTWTTAGMGVEVRP